jgi:hypothetical protein
VRTPLAATAQVLQSSPAVGEVLGIEGDLIVATDNATVSDFYRQLQKVLSRRGGWEPECSGLQRRLASASLEVELRRLIRAGLPGKVRRPNIWLVPLDWRSTFNRLQATRLGLPPEATLNAELFDPETGRFIHQFFGGDLQHLEIGYAEEFESPTVVIKHPVDPVAVIKVACLVGALNSEECDPHSEAHEYVIDVGTGAGPQVYGGNALRQTILHDLEYIPGTATFAAEAPQELFV